MKKNTTKIFIAAVFLTISGTAFAQQCRVWINTSSSVLTFVVVASATDLTRTDGFIAPRITGDQLKAKDSNYTTAQDGAIVYVTAVVASTSDKTTNVTSIGYYYFDKTQGTAGRWMKIANPSAAAIYQEPWYNVTGGTPATSNTASIYQLGQVGIGTNSPRSRLHLGGENTPTLTIRGNGVGNTDSYPQGSIRFLESGTVNWGMDIVMNSPATTTTPSFNNLTFRSNEGGTVTDIMTIQSSYNVATENSTGRVGIGTIAPTNKLHVYATADPVKFEGLQNGASTDQIVTVDTNGVLKKVNSSSLPNSTYQEPWYKVGGTPSTSNTDDIYQLGKVGINTNSPSNNLHVKGTSPGNNEVIVKVEDNNMSSGNKVLIKLGKNDSGKKDAADIIYYYDADNSNSNRIDFGFSGNSESMSLTSQGNFGIGTNAPAQRLDVNGTAKAVNLTNGGTAPGSNDFGLYSQTPTLMRYVTAATDHAWYTDGASGNNYGGTNPSMLLSLTGNLGIGTTNPSQKLDVNGASRLRGQIYDNNNVAGASGQVLSTNSSGQVVWQNNVAITPAVTAVFPRTNQDMTWDQDGYTGTTLTLPPGKWSVQVAILIDTTISNAGSAGWFRTSFSDSPASTSASSDFVGATKASGAITGPAQFGLVSGTVIINNTSGASKTYYLVKQAYYPNIFGIAQGNWVVKNFGRGIASEDQIIAYPMN